MKPIFYESNNEITLKHRITFDGEMQYQTFSEFIKEKRREEESPSWKSMLTTRELADKLGITYEQFRKIINMNKPTKKRDCIIAICAALNMDSEETNKALIKYQYMPILNPDNPRDDLIIDILEEQAYKHLSISQIDQILMRNGFPELDIIDHRPSSKQTTKKDLFPYKLIRKQVRSLSEDLIFGNQYDSLESEYTPNRYRCVAEMWLYNSQEKKNYCLAADTTQTYYVQTYTQNEFDIKTYNDISESKLFESYFLELDTMVKHELKNMLSLLNDTKNYHLRVNAKILDDALHIYAETYNYTVPELNEYYMFEYINGKTIMSVYSDSQFMRRHLHPTEYKSLYGNNTSSPIAQYISMEDFNLNKIAHHSINKYHLNCRLSYFKKLKEEADILLQNLREKTQYIRNLDYIYDHRDKVCEFFHVEKEFKCRTSGEYGDIVSAGIDTADFYFKDCGIVTITLSDLYTAFELGFNNINQICRIKKNLGSIEKILYQPA